MLVYLDDSIASHIQEHGACDEHVDALEDIASVLRSGTHLIVGGYAALNFLSKFERLGDSARTAYRSILNKYSQLGSALQYVSAYAIVACGDFELEELVDDGRRIIRVPLEGVCAINLKSPTEIIFEEINDRHIYEIISKWYLRAYISPGVMNREYRPVHGGGGRTVAVYQEAQERNNGFCLCVTDTDKKYPGDDCGATSVAVRGVNDPGKVLSFHMDLDFHEIENLVPLNFLDEKSSSRVSKRIIEIIRIAERNGFPEAKLFWDYKKGFTMHSFKNKPDAWRYWKGALELEEMECAVVCDARGCACEVIAPWPEKQVIRAEIEKEVEMDPRDCSILNSLWEAIGRTIVSWSISSVPKVA